METKEPVMYITHIVKPEGYPFFTHMKQVMFYLKKGWSKNPTQLFHCFNYHRPYTLDMIDEELIPLKKPVKLEPGQWIWGYQDGKLYLGEKFDIPRLATEIVVKQLVN
ncbi:TPA: hypothetical protein DEP21_05475 [Patescibacteria group bacterium]|nr:hypothetical protein [Candidatus Gracilibacteria bacterium]